MTVEYTRMATTIAVSNETEASAVCFVNGRKLTYEMKVLQQPERARACGAGAKCTQHWKYPCPSMLRLLPASADRRPVDPPPVVELKILEGESRTDVTFSHNSNFFLFTTLESARPIANSRASSVSPPHPVLTGMPVAGMAYLDRPSPAGYFIFPDLSVRHEGKYRLSFNLFEETKARDMETDPALTNQPSTSNQGRAPQAPPSNCVPFRLEVKSRPFVVYSAKKFPGLAESTSLSRLVAEQGCRVRIRRDVRMRRRDTKTSKEFEDLDDEGASYTHADRYTTPDNYGQVPVVERARSVSTTSVDASPIPYPLAERRSSIQEGCYYNPQSWQQPAVAPIIQTAAANYNTHLAFGNHHPGPQCQAPVLSAAGPAVSQPPTPYGSNLPGYQNQPLQSHSRQASNGSEYTYHPQAFTQSHFGGQIYSDAPDYRPAVSHQRSNMSQPSSATRDAVSYPVVDSRITSGNQSYFVQSPAVADQRSSTPTGLQNLPPLKALQPSSEKKYEHPTAQSIIAEAGEASPQASFDANSSYPSLAGPMHSASDNLSRPGKRSYGKVFDTGHISQPTRGGARPEAIGQDVPQVECDEGPIDEVDLANLKILSYRRADGSKQHKKIPSPVG